MAALYKPWYKNPFILVFIINLLGFMSLSFVGKDYKIGRIACTLLIWLYTFTKISRISNWILRDPIVKTCIYYCVFCIPSILFSERPDTVAFKLLEVFLIPLTIGLGVKYFEYGKGKNIYTFLCLYFILQTFVAFLGYFLDPNALHDEDMLLMNRVYVPMLKCNYPPFSSNSLGGVAAVSFMSCLSYYAESFGKHIRFKRKAIIIFAAVVSCFVLYKSSSRTAMLATLIGVVYASHKILSMDKKICMVFIICGVALLFSTQIINAVIAIMMKSQTQASLEGGDSSMDMLLSGRLRIWEAALENPIRLLLGMGFGTAILDAGINDGNAHNSIVEILLNAGVFALFFWLKIWYLLYKRYIFLTRRAQELPYAIQWYHCAIAIAFVAFVRSFGNLSFVYWQLDGFTVIAIAILFVYSTRYVRNSI